MRTLSNFKKWWNFHKLQLHKWLAPYQVHNEFYLYRQYSHEKNLTGHFFFVFAYCKQSKTVQREGNDPKACPRMLKQLYFALSACITSLPQSQENKIQ